MFGYEKLKQEFVRLAGEVEDLERDLKSVSVELMQIKCEHRSEYIEFVQNHRFTIGNFFDAYKNCKKCGKELERYFSYYELYKAKSEWHKEESERLNPAQEQQKEVDEGCLRGNGWLYGTDCGWRWENFAVLQEPIKDGDLIQKVKGRWVHVRSGKVLKVKK